MEAWSKKLRQLDARTYWYRRASPLSQIIAAATAMLAITKYSPAFGPLSGAQKYRRKSLYLFITFGVSKPEMKNPAKSLT